MYTPSQGFNPDNFLWNTFFDASNDKKNYPPFNLVNYKDKAVVEMALAGFTREEISVKLNKQVLTISGEKHVVKEPKGVVEHRGIAFRPFTKEFVLNPKAGDISASFENGLLTIEIEFNVEQPEQIEIM